MGTLLFTVALVCFPVMFAYHIVFCVARLAVVGSQGSCGIVQLAWQAVVQGGCILAVTTLTSAPLYSGTVLERFRPASVAASIDATANGDSSSSSRTRHSNGVGGGYAGLKHIRLKRLKPTVAALVGSGGVCGVRQPAPPTGAWGSPRRGGKGAPVERLKRVSGLGSRPS